MNRRKIFASIILTILFAGISPAQIGTENITFRTADFDESLINAVEPNVMGYQYVLIRNEQIVSAKAGGKAQNAADAGGDGLDMTVNRPINIGSLAKFLSGTAMLHLMEKPAGPGGSWDQGKTLSQKLNRRFRNNDPRCLEVRYCSKNGRHAVNSGRHAAPAPAAPVWIRR